MTGDSIGSQDAHQDHMRWVIDTLYPGAGIEVVNMGSGGKSSGTAVTNMEMLPPKGHKNRPSIVTVMYGVNDLRWNWNNMPAKAKSFVKNLTTAIDMGRKKGVEVILLRETYFTRGAATDGYAAALTAALEYLLEAQDRLAAEKNVPVIDVLGAYRRAIYKAWIRDLDFRFTPDMIHPVQAGHAAVAVEVLRAMGVGLPLATEKRGPLHLVHGAPVKIEAVDNVAIVPDGETLELKVQCRNLSGKPVDGDVTIVAAPYKATQPAKIAPYGMAKLTFHIPADKMKGRWAIMPLYMFFRGKGGMFAAEHALFQYARVTPVGKAVTVKAKDFGNWELVRSDKTPCPVTEAVASAGPGGMTIKFQWDDKTPAAVDADLALGGGGPRRIPLDLNARTQKCDAVEFIFDLRPSESTGRFNCAIAQTPKGAIRVGVYKIREDGKLVPRLMTPPKLPRGTVSLVDKGDNACVLYLRTPPKGPTVSWTMRVTDAKKPGVEGALYLLTGKTYVLPEPMGYMRHAVGKESGMLFRVGY